MTPWRRRHHASAALLVGLLAGCGDDADEPCFVALDAWCAKHDCGPTRTIEDALGRLPPRSDAAVIGQLFLSNLEVYECDGLFSYHVGDGFVGAILYYAADSGALVGSLTYSDIIEEKCPMQRGSGQRPSGDCEPCALIGNSFEDACRSERADPYVELCMSEPPAPIAPCADCACRHCYPLVVACATAPRDAGYAWAGLECDDLLERCAVKHDCDCGAP